MLNNYILGLPTLVPEEPLFCFTGLSKGVFLQELIKAKMLKQKRDLIDRRIVIASLTDSGRGTLKKTDEY